MNKTTRKHNALELKDRISIYEFLKGVCSTNEEGMAVYKTGWDDDAVARHLKVTVNNIYGVRLNVFGKLHSPRKPKIDDIIYELIDRVDAIEKRLGLPD